VLDEMNIARVEYYFAEMLSVLEMPRSDEWLIDIVTTVWDNDPCLINSGKIKINQNTWFVGTINNDDSTFAVADKVYDRAIPIDLDTKAAAFTAPDTEPIHISAEHLISMFNEAKKKYPISEENMKKLEEMDQYVIKHFRLAFGNRIMKQLKDFVPCYVAC
jgi:5-methylcytosine-specific restriction endonuclease McrBC GTP-binding regulatory subunit McrB